MRTVSKRRVGQVADLPAQWQVGNLPHGLTPSANGVRS
jgi:hypothetical protein